MGLDSHRVELLLALFGVANAVWSVVLTHITTRKAKADMRQIAETLTASFSQIAAELVRNRKPSSGRRIT
ncbi:hypothetical protein DDF62_17305 [Caulobacter radicis]|uniref:hypothetical protein n=1 Tax=Caulobacter radicis TaxID=2172650 RepID=UPI000D579270|nr:hypothetical protein [Caulobacter radicis]PVM86811.1 hypothetical protein DDF62_17305 [Caulobacter radicis]